MINTGTGPMAANSILPELRTLFETGTPAGMTDGQLLGRFAACRDATGEAAFAATVARHGPMVLRICRGLLGDAHEAEDAFQATFLVLAQRARSVRDPELLGNWLFGVAHRTAQKARTQRARRQRRESREAAMKRGELTREDADPDHQEDIQALHEEVAQLPGLYRLPIVRSRRFWSAALPPRRWSLSSYSRRFCSPSSWIERGSPRCRSSVS
jgi:RNA polymerase sigma factor (sigma-70 family)